MFGIDWSDPQTFWLNIANAALGIVTVACVCAVAWAVLLEGYRKRKAAHPLAEDDHIIDVPGLGLTMADGGTKLPEKRNL